MFHTLGPAHVAHVNQPIDTLFNLDECAVVGDADHAAFDMRAYRITMSGVLPGIRRELLEAERYSLLVGIVLQNLYVNFVAYVHQVTGMSEPAPGHIRNVEQPINATQVDEGAIVSKVFDYTGEFRPFRQML